jgi:uncharacterized protein
VDTVKRKAKLISITTPIPKIATHPEDDLVLATAESGNAEYIVTGDNQLQSLKRFKDTKIVNPKIFSQILDTLYFQ